MRVRGIVPATLSLFNKRSRPYGSEPWVSKAVAQFGLENTIRNPWPRKGYLTPFSPPTNRAYGGSTMLGQTIGFIAGLVSEERVFQQVTSGPYEQDARQVQLGLAIVVHASLIKEAIEMLPIPSA